MNKSHITAILAITSLSFNAGAMAQSISKSEYLAVEKNIKAEYLSAKTNCGSFTNNAKDICIAEAKGNEKVAKTELEARYKPYETAEYEISIVKAGADYKVAKEKCDDKVGNVKTICVKEAEAILVRITSNARAQIKTLEANTTANEESSAARMKAEEKGNKARQYSAADKRIADYALAKEKCGAMSGDSKGLCVKEAKMHYSK